jgi:hypothetical protein
MPSDDQKQMQAAISSVLGLIKSTASAGNLSVVTITPPSGTEMDLVFMNSKTTIAPSADTLVLLVNLTNSQLNLAADVKLSLSDPTTNSLVLFLIDATTGDIQGAMPPFQKSDSGPIPIGPNQMILFALESPLNQGDSASVDIVANTQPPPIATNPTKPTNNSVSKNNHMLFSGIVGLTLILLLAIILYFVFGKKNKAGFRRRRF